MGERVDVLQLDHPPGQQTQGPAPMLLGWGRAGQGDQLGFLFAIELALVETLADTIGAESGLQALFDEAPSQALHGRAADIQRRDDPLVGPCRAALGLVGLEQDLGVLQLADIGFAPGEQLFQLVGNCSTPPHSNKLLREKRFSACRNRPEWEARKCDIGSEETVIVISAIRQANHYST